MVVKRRSKDSEAGANIVDLPIQCIDLCWADDNRVMSSPRIDLFCTHITVAVFLGGENYLIVEH